MKYEKKYSVSLCVPNDQVSCFACCPPIRPAGYDHIFHISSLKREIRENTLRFKKYGPGYKPIVGYYCWALGYIDESCRKIGCLLHPLMNSGKDLRYMVNYGNKCAREKCYQATVFDALSHECKLFWLEITNGLNSFYFSSKKANPIFHILNWGNFLLEHLFEYASLKGYICTELLWRLPFLINRKVAPRKWRLPVKMLCNLADNTPLEDIKWSAYFTYFEKSFTELQKELRVFLKGDGTYVHLLGLDEDLSEFIRFFAKLTKINGDGASTLYKKITEIVLKFIDRVQNGNRSHSKRAICL